MNGKEFRLKRFLSRSSKLVVAACDHGTFLGPIPGLLDPRTAYEKLQRADGVLMSPGMIHHVNDLLIGPPSPALITRLTWNSNFGFHSQIQKGYHGDMLSVSQAAAMGVDLVVSSLALDTGDERIDAENAGLFSHHVQQSIEMGIPFIGEFYPPKLKELTPDQLHRQTQITCRIMAELGADLIKTVYSGPRFREIVESTPIPLLVLGAEKMPREELALQLALDAANAGAAGIVFGRNIVQSRDPAAFIEAARAVMEGKCKVGEAIAKYHLEETPRAGN